VNNSALHVGNLASLTLLTNMAKLMGVFFFVPFLSRFGLCGYLPDSFVALLLSFLELLRSWVVQKFIAHDWGSIRYCFACCSSSCTSTLLDFFLVLHQRRSFPSTVFCAWDGQPLICPRMPLTCLSSASQARFTALERCGKC
jgi:hypothetical protein